MTTGPAFPLLTDNDDKHRQLAQGAVKYAREHLKEHADSDADIYTPSSDITQEAISAWMGVGLVHRSYSQWELEQIANAVIGQVATVLVMVGWQPPARLLGGGESCEQKVQNLLKQMQILVARYPDCETVITFEEIKERSDVGVVLAQPVDDGIRLTVRQR